MATAEQRIDFGCAVCVSVRVFWAHFTVKRGVIEKLSQFLTVKKYTYIFIFVCRCLAVESVQSEKWQALAWLQFCDKTVFFIW